MNASPWRTLAAFGLVEMQGEDLEFFELKSAADIPSKMPLYRKIWGPHAKLKASMLQDLEKGRECEIITSTA